MDIQYIYKLTSPSGKVYIGRTDNFDRRMIEHKASSKKILHRSLYKAIRKYGWDSFQKEIIAECIGEDNAQVVEEGLIKKYNSVKKGYNDTYGGNGRNIWKENPELLEKLKKTLSEKFSGEKNPMYGKKHSKSAIQKQKEKAKGRFSLEWYIDRNGKEEGTRLYEERRVFLKNRNLPKDENGKFLKKL
jgi:group I intron endonuclease